MPPGCLTASVAVCRDVADRVLLYHLNTGPDWQCQQHLSLRRCTGQSKQGVQDPQTAVFLTKCDSSVSKTSMKPSTHHAVKTFMLFWLWIFVINSNVKESALFPGWCFWKCSTSDKRVKTRLVAQVGVCGAQLFHSLPSPLCVAPWFGRGSGTLFTAPGPPLPPQMHFFSTCQY